MKYIYAHSSNNILSDTASSPPAPKLISLVIATALECSAMPNAKEGYGRCTVLIGNDPAGSLLPLFPNGATNNV
jgi:hypothetical protein